MKIALAITALAALSTIFLAGQDITGELTDDHYEILFLEFIN